MRDERCPLCMIGATPSEWLLGYTQFQPEQEGTREALLTLGNGYLATRGAAPEARADGIHYPATYVAGVYNRLTSEVGGRVREDESIVNLPDWSALTFRASESSWSRPRVGEFVHHHVALDLREAVLVRESVVHDEAGRRTRISQRRIVSMAAQHVAALQTTIVAENWSGRLEVRSSLDARVENRNVAAFGELASRHLEQVAAGSDGETVWLVTETSQSYVRVAEVARTRVLHHHADVERRVLEEPGRIGHDLCVDVREGEAITVEKVAAVFTTRDRAISEPLLAAREEIGHTPDFEELLGPHTLAWKQLWRRSRLVFDGGEDDQLAVNVHMFHVLQTLSPHTADLDVGVSARGLHGEGYLGHVFWDETFVFPLLTLRFPELTRALLLYRYRRLPQARRLAVSAGFRGALFPWQSGSDGREETPAQFFNPRSGRWMDDNSRRQYHVSLAVAYNVWHYWEVTADLGFLSAYGAEILVEIARFWASLAAHDAEDDRYDIRAVMGPDEFHDGYPDRPGLGIDNSAYVNVMTAWMLGRARDAYDVLGHHHSDDLWERLGLTDAELATWERMSRRLRIPFFDNGMLAQFEGYDRLHELDWDTYRARYGDIGRLDLILEAEGDTTNRYQASKQADVLMLYYLFTAEELTAIVERMGYAFDPATIPASVEYYLARTTHGSTLSRVIHAWVLARTDRQRSLHLLREALVADLADTQGGTTREGIHLGAMACTVDILQRCYTGLDVRDGVLWLNPLLPDELPCLEFEIRYRGHRIALHVDHQHLTLRALPCAAPPVDVAIGDVMYRLGAGAKIDVVAPHLGQRRAP